jgi:hypothetical protein
MPQARIERGSEQCSRSGPTLQQRESEEELRDRSAAATIAYLGDGNAYPSFTVHPLATLCGLQQHLLVRTCQKRLADGVVVTHSAYKSRAAQIGSLCCPGQLFVRFPPLDSRALPFSALSMEEEFGQPLSPQDRDFIWPIRSPALYLRHRFQTPLLGRRKRHTGRK